VTDFLQMIATLREQMHAELTRTDVLRPLIWPITGLLAALTGALATKAPVWLLIGLAGAAGLMLTVYVGGYIYFVIKDPDALRSEKYKLQKLALEHGLYGDSAIGLIDANDTAPLAASMKTIGESNHE